MPAPSTSLSFDLVVTTLGRESELDGLLASVAAQEGTARLVVVDQNADERVARVLARHADLRTLHLHSATGVSRGRNAALPVLEADVVAFPDDDCTYPPGLLAAVAERFTRPDLDGLTVQVRALDGEADGRWTQEAGAITIDNVWYSGISASLFLRRGLVQSIGPFDEQLGVGSGQDWSAGEETDYMLRALATGARLEFDPSLTVHHPVRRHSAAGLAARGYRDGASLGYLLRKHRLPSRLLARMLFRPLGGVMVGLARLDARDARFHAATLRGRVSGYRRASPSVQGTR